MGKKLNISRFRPLLVSVLSILFGFAAGSLLLLASGVDPMECYLYLFRGGISTTTRIFNTLANAILAKSDQTRAMMERNFENGERETIIRTRGIQ